MFYFIPFCFVPHKIQKHITTYVTHNQDNSNIIDDRIDPVKSHNYVN